MKIKKSLLKKIILEALTTSTTGKSVKGMKPTKDYPEAVMISPNDSKKLLASLKVTSKYLSKPQYIWKKSNVGASDNIFLIGSLTNGNGDPYTYEKVGDKYRVISGPEPKTIGKTFVLKSPPTVKTEELSQEEETGSARKESILDMTLVDYGKLLTPEQKQVFNNWSVFGNKKLTVGDWLTKDSEIIKNDLSRGKKTAEAVRSGTSQAGSFRAPLELLNVYADYDENNPSKESLRAVYETAIDTLYTPDLQAEIDKL